MRHPQLHEALRTCAVEAGHLLAQRVAAGEEVPYELVEHRRGQERRRGRGGGSGPVLYSYRPLVGLYLEKHAALLRAEPAFGEATHAMVAAWGVEAYLQARGVALAPADAHERARIAVRQFLERVYEDAPGFAFDDDRCDAALAELDAVLTAGATEIVAVAPLAGVRLELGTVALGRGVALQHPDVLVDEAPEEALLGPDGALADAVLTVRWEGSAADPEIAGRARAAVERVLLALRLHGGGVSPASGPLMWVRSAGGPWRAHALGGSHAARGALLLAEEDVPDLQAFLALVARRQPRGDALGWAMRRWVLGLDRADPAEALTDFLLAARALLEPEGPVSGRVCGRLAALCAPDDERASTTARMARACAAERALREGRTVAPEAVAALSDELADHLRAILRDVVCGHLDEDLCALADDLLEGALEARAADETADELWWTGGAPSVRPGPGRTGEPEPRSVPDDASAGHDADLLSAVGVDPFDALPDEVDGHEEPVASDEQAPRPVADQAEAAQAGQDLPHAATTRLRPRELDWSATGWVEDVHAAGIVPGQPLGESRSREGIEDWGFDFHEIVVSRPAGG